MSWSRAGMAAVVVMSLQVGQVQAGDVPRAVEAALRQRARHDLGCGDVSITAVGGNAYAVSGCSKRTTYVCTSIHHEATCARESAVESSAPPGNQPRGTVARRYDEARQLHVVSARFTGFPNNYVIDVLGAPQAVLDRVHVRITRAGVPSNPTACDRLTIRVNDVPTEGTSVRADGNLQRWRTDVKGEFRFEWFRPLARRHSTFALDVCGAKVRFSEEQTNELRRFLEIFSQIAADVQSGAVEQRTSLAADVISL